MGIIYKITNKISGKMYVGQTSTTLEKRWKVHLKHAKAPKFHFQRALALYGPDVWTKEVLEDVSDSLLNEREVYWIAFFDSCNCGYNRTTGGEAPRGHKMSDEHKEKLSERMKGNTHTKGINLTEDHKRKISEGGKGKARSEAKRGKPNVWIQEYNKKPMSETRRQSIIDSWKRRKESGNATQSEESNQKRRETMLRRHEEKRLAELA